MCSAHIDCTVAFGLFFIEFMGGHLKYGVAFRKITSFTAVSAVVSKKKKKKKAAAIIIQWV